MIHDGRLIGFPHCCRDSYLIPFRKKIDKGHDTAISALIRWVLVPRRDAADHLPCALPSLGGP